jgi:hypothetical protein
VLAGATTTEVVPADENRGTTEAGIVQIVLFILTALSLPDVVEEILTQTVEGDTFHETGRDDAVSVDIVAGHINASAGYLLDRFGCHSAIDKILNYELIV